MNFSIPKLMNSNVLTGHGRIEKLKYRSDVEVPTANNFINE